MAFITPEQKKLKIFSVVFVVILVVVFIVVYFGFWRKPSSSTTNMPLPITNDEYAKSLNNLKIDWQFLDSQTFKDLKFFGENPVTPGDKGRQNPFLPF